MTILTFLLKSATEKSSKIFVKSCVDAVKDWFKENMIIIGGVAVGVALLQVKTGLKYKAFDNIDV